MSEVNPVTWSAKKYGLGDLAVARLKNHASSGTVRGQVESMRFLHRKGWVISHIAVCVAVSRGVKRRTGVADSHSCASSSMNPGVS